MTRRLATAAVNQLRDNHWVYNSATGLYERSTLLEMAGTNICLQSENFGVTWAAVNTPTRVAAAHNASRVTLDLLGDDSATNPEGYSQDLVFTGNAVKSVSVHFRPGSSLSSLIHLADVTAVANRLVIGVATVDGIPSITQNVGTYIGYEFLTDGTVRLYFLTSAVTAANTNRLFIYPAETTALAGTSQGTAYFGGIQAEDSLIPTSYIKTTTVAVTRSADSLSIAHTDLPRSGTFYTKFVERGTVRISEARIWHLGAADGSLPHLHVRQDGGPYRLRYEQAAGAVESTLSAAPVWGDTVELSGTFGENAAVQLSQSINGGAVEIAAADGGVAMVSAWSDDLLWLNSVGGSAIGAMALMGFKYAYGVKTLLEMRALADMASAVLVLNAGATDAITIKAQQGAAGDPTDIGTLTRAFAGNARISTRDQKRVLPVTSAPVTTVEKQAILAMIANNVLLPCSGLLLDHDTVECSVRCTNAEMWNGHPGLWTLTLVVTEK